MTSGAPTMPRSLSLLRLSRSYRIGGGTSIDGPGPEGGGGSDTPLKVGAVLGTGGEPGPMVGTGVESGPSDELAGPVGSPLGPDVATALGPGDSVAGALQLAINVPTMNSAAMAATAIRPRATKRRRVTGFMRTRLEEARRRCRRAFCAL